MLFESTVPQFIIGLKSLDQVLAKAAAFADSKKIDSKVLMETRLYPNMLTLMKQIQIACDAAKFCAGKVSEQKDIPKHEDNEVTIGEARERVGKVISYLQKFSPEDFIGKENVKVTVSFMPGKYLTAKDYVYRMAVPNFYFHMTTTYAIFRQMGVDLGKMDFLGDVPFKDL